MALTPIDRQLLERCLQRKPRAWEDFVDRFLGLVIHVVQHSARVWSIRLTPEDRDDLCAEVLLELVQNDFAVLRHFRGTSSLATYLTVVARRIVLKELRRRPSAVALTDALGERLGRESVAAQGQPDLSLEEHEEVERLLAELPEREARIVRMYHLDEKSYRDISRSLGIPENSVGPLLSRARTRMRRAGRYPSLPRCSQ